MRPQMNFSSMMHAPQLVNQVQLADELDSDSDEDEYVPEDYNEPE